MSKSYPLSLHIFRRDLRLQDNTALIEALKSSEWVIPCFIFDNRQLGNNNAYRSDNCIQFMANSLQELNMELQKKSSELYFFQGIAEDVVADLIVKMDIKAVFINRDYTPFSLSRDKKIEAVCEQRGIDFHFYSDALLHEPEEIFKSDSKPYTIFTHFFKKSLQLPIQTTKKNPYSNYYRKSISTADQITIKNLLTINNPHILLNGGRTEALSLLNRIKHFKDYDTIRNCPNIDGTTKLSAHNKFGTISIREFYEKIVENLSKQHTLVNELHWRDFFTHITFNFPNVLGSSFHGKYDGMSWSQSEKDFDAWCVGKTGFPIVDAGMRELNQTGYMHNRVRMVCASFLTKDLHIDWRWGEKYFAQHLIDYDPAVNNGNWQWAASTGCDAQPYFRIFNPWLQQKKFDQDCIYIKKWVPELNRLSPKIIHNLTKLEIESTLNYPKPIVDHALESQKAKVMYKYAKP